MWTAPKIAAMLLKVAPAKTEPNLRLGGMNKPVRAPSPRMFGAGSQTGYGRK